MVQPIKVETVKQTTDRLSRAQSVLLVQYKGMTVAELRELRGQLRQTGGELRVVKNSLVNRALSNASCDSLEDLLKGPTALVFGYEDPTGPPKVCTKYAESNAKLEILGGLLEKKRIDVSKVKALAKLPGREELLSQMASTMKAPMRQMVVALKQAMSKMVYAMRSRADQMEPQA